MFKRSTSGRLLNLSVPVVSARAFFILDASLEQFVEHVVGTGSEPHYSVTTDSLPVKKITRKYNMMIMQNI